MFTPRDLDNFCAGFLRAIVARTPTMGDIRHFSFREWNHARMAKNAAALPPLTKKDRARLCRKLTLSDRGVVVNDPDYVARRAAVVGAR